VSAEAVDPKELATLVAALAAIVEDLLEAAWTKQELDVKRIGRLRFLASVTRDRAEQLGGVQRKGR
jgi:hypothetical protein